MKIAMIGAGGVGGYFGARLAAAGEDVWFVARGRHLAAMREEGLRVESPLGDLHLRPTRATDDPKEIGPVDTAILAVKLWDTETAAVAARPLLGPDTAIVSLQNGIDAGDRLAKVLGAGHVLLGSCQISAAIAAPGVVRQVGRMAKIQLGERDGRPSERVGAFLAAARRAGVEIEAPPDIDINRALWEKFVFLASFSGITALTRLPKGPIWANPETKALFADAIAEVIAVARARGADLRPDHVDRAMAFGEKLPAEMKASMLVDLERGNRLELPWLSGAVVRLGRELGVPTPVHRAILAALAPYAEGAPKV
jgi:2-dehydropantoate 2-reductase